MKTKPPTSAMPVSKAKTAYGLLSEIRQIILEEPKRYNQFATLDLQSEEIYSPSYFPACGTVGCVAGWVAALKSATPLESSVTAYARRVLGLMERQAAVLFDGCAAGSCQQTLGHAKRGAKHIAAFQRKYAKQLKAKKV